MSRTNVNETLKEGGRGNAGGAKARRLTSAMVIAELTLTLVLLTGAGLMIRSFLKIYAMQLGIDSTHILTMQTTLTEGRYPTAEKRQQFYDALLARLAALPGVTAAATTTRLPLEGGDSRIMEVEGRPAVDPEERPPRLAAVGQPWLLRRAGHPGPAGPPVRGTATARPAPKPSVVSERFVERFFPGEDPLGKRFRPHAEPSQKDPNPWLTIVGVVPSVRQANPQADESRSDHLPAVPAAIGPVDCADACVPQDRRPG